MLFGQLGQRQSLHSNGGKQNYHIVDCTAENGADEYPQKAGQITKLCRQNRADKRARAGYGREVMPEQDVSVCGMVILPVAQGIGRRRPGAVEHENFGDDKLCIESVRYCEQE